MKGPPNIENLRLYYTYYRATPCVSCDMWIVTGRGGHEGEVIKRDLVDDVKIQWTKNFDDITLNTYMELIQKYEKPL